MSVLVPKKNQITTVKITQINNPTMVSASVTTPDGNTAAVEVPASAVVGDQIALNSDGTLPAAATAEDNTFLSAADVAANFYIVTA